MEKIKDYIFDGLLALLFISALLTIFAGLVWIVESL